MDPGMSLKQRCPINDLIRQVDRAKAALDTAMEDDTLKPATRKAGRVIRPTLKER